MNNFTVDMAAKSENLNSNSITRLNKQNMMLKFMEKNLINLTQHKKKISKQSGFSDSTIKRYRDDINVDTFHVREKHKKKNSKTIETQSLTPSEKIKNNKIT